MVHSINFLNCLGLAVLSLQQVLKVHEDQSLRIRGSSHLSVECLICFFFWSGSLQHHVTFTCALFNLTCKVSVSFSSIPFIGLHAFQVCSHIKDSLSSQPNLPKEPVSHHCSTPVMGDIPPHLGDPKIIALQLSSDFSLKI